MNKFKIILISILLVALTILTVIPAQAQIGIEPGQFVAGPDEFPVCCCSVEPHNCWCARVK